MHVVVTLQSNQQWSNHIEGIKAKVSYTLGMILRNIKVPKPVKTQIYQALIRPWLEYALSA